MRVVENVSLKIEWICSQQLVLIYTLLRTNMLQ